MISVQERIKLSHQFANMHSDLGRAIFYFRNKEAPLHEIERCIDVMKAAVCKAQCRSECGEKEA